MTHSRDEVEAAFVNYWRTGAVGEDWEAWADLFTDDAVYVEHMYGVMHGRAAIRDWIVPVMAHYSDIYTVYEWHMIDGDRVAFRMQNRRDHPDPTQPPIDFPGITILDYAGDGKFSLEEDYWAVKAAQEASAQYEAACTATDPDHPKRMTRQHWPAGPDWAVGPPVGPRPSVL
jgi:hypothetical protein